MKKITDRVVWTALAHCIGMFAVLMHAAPVLAQTTGPLMLVRTITLPDVRGRIDHLAVDLAGGRLFIAALANDTLEVVDIGSGRWIARIQGMREPQGVAFIPEKLQLFVANGEGRSVDVFDRVLAPIGRFDSLKDADNIRYDATGGRLFVGYASALAMIDAATMKKSGDIPLSGHPEAFQLDGSRSRIYVNVPSARHIAVVDGQKGTVSETWDLADMRGNFPMALDEGVSRLFVATRQPAAVLVYDASKGTRIARISGCGDADDMFFDADARRLYVICGEGVVDIFQQSNADQYVKAGQVRTAPGARTGLFVPSSRTLFVAVPAQSSKAAEIREYHVQ